MLILWSRPDLSLSFLIWQNILVSPFSRWSAAIFKVCWVLCSVPKLEAWCITVIKACSVWATYQLGSIGKLSVEGKPFKIARGICLKIKGYSSLPDFNFKFLINRLSFHLNHWFRLRNRTVTIFQLHVGIWQKLNWKWRVLQISVIKQHIWIFGFLGRAEGKIPTPNVCRITLQEDGPGSPHRHSLFPSSTDAKAVKREGTWGPEWRETWQEGRSRGTARPPSTLQEWPRRRAPHQLPDLSSYWDRNFWGPYLEENCEDSDCYSHDW